MSLLTRLVKPVAGEIKIPVHQFMAALAEYKRPDGLMTGVRLATTFDLSSAEITQLQNFLDRVDNDSITREEIHDVLMLAETNPQIYTTQEVIDRLL